MALTPSKSLQYTDFSASPKVMVKPHDWGSKIRASFSKLTFTVAGQGTAQMIRLPAGSLRILTDLSRIVCPAGVAGALLDLGHAAFVNQAGATVAAAPTAFVLNQSITSAIDIAWTLPADGYFDFDSREGVDIEVVIDTQNSPAAGDMICLAVYMQGN